MGTSCTQVNADELRETDCRPVSPGHGSASGVLHVGVLGGVGEPEPLVDRDRGSVVRLDVEDHLAQPE